MKYGNTIKEFGLNGSQFDMDSKSEHECFAGKCFVNKSILFYLITVGLVMFLSTESVYGQFLVQPAKIEEVVQARNRIKTTLSVHNFDPNESIVVDFKVIELIQDENGEWLPVDTDPNSDFDYYPTLDISKLSSCRTWIKLENSSVEIVPNGDVNLELTLTVPTRPSLGFHGAAIIASTSIAAREGVNVPLVMRIVVPVIANVQSRPLASKIEILDVGMECIPSDGEIPGKTLATMTVQNNGKTFPRIIPVVRIRGFLGGHWRLISTHQFDEIGIIPAAELILKSDIGKNLPSSKYQITGALYVDDRIAKRFATEIDYTGDPIVTKTPTDVPLDIEPKEITIMAAPGAKRNERIKIISAAAEPVEIQTNLIVPQIFKGIAVGGVPAANMACPKWLTVEPETLTLNDFGSRNIRVIAEMPENAVMYPNYYAELNLKVLYADGQVAGTTPVRICVSNRNAVTEADIECLMIDLREQNLEKSEYIFLVGFVNNGKVHINPKRCKVAVAKADGWARAAALLKSTESGMMLPSESRTYSGTLDLSGLDADSYSLEVLLEYPPGQGTSKQIALRIIDQGGVKIPEITQQEVKASELIKVQW